jgi:hypothetical protein
MTEVSERQEILDWITPIDSALQQNDIISRREIGTGQWLLDSAAFQAWVRNNNQTLFCPGILGAGKTILTSVVVEELSMQFKNSSNVGIAYLYCNYQLQKYENSKDLFASLLRQFVQGQSSLPESIKTLYLHHQTRRTRPSLDEILQAIQSLVVVYSKVFIIVDALDKCQKCNGYRQIFLSKLFYLKKELGLNLFATSRPISSIEKEFKGSPKLKIRGSDEDVRRYLDGHILRLSESGALSNPTLEKVKTAIVKAVDGMYIIYLKHWLNYTYLVRIALVQLYLQFLIGKRSEKATRRALKYLAKGSADIVYEDTMERIYGQVSDNVETAEQVLAWITCAKRPLTISEIQHALAVRIGESELDEGNIYEAEDIISVCAGLVSIDIDSSTVQFAHYELLEFFRRTQQKWFPDAETTITTTCVTYLSFRAFETGFCQTDEDFEARLRSHSLYRYAARYWGDHARAVSANVGEITMNFLKNEDKVSSSYQALIASRHCSDRQGYSQGVPRQVTGLHLAAYFGLENVTALLSCVFHPTCRDSRGQTPLWWAALNDSKPVIKLLSQRDRVTLPILVREGKQDLIKTIIRAGYDVNSRGVWNRTLLHDAILSTNSELSQDIISAGVDINSEDSDGRTALQLAVLHKHLNMVEVLLENSASTKDVTIDDWRSAYGKQDSDILKLLEGPGREKFVQFIQEGELQNELMDPPHGHGIQRRLL